VELALRHVCLAAPTVRDVLDEAVQAMAVGAAGSFCILLRSRSGTAFKGLYRLQYDEEDASALCLVRVCGAGPMLLRSGDLRAAFKFDTAGKRFQPLPKRALESADAIALR